MNFTKSLTFMFCLISIALGAKPTDQYKDANSVIRSAKPTDQYKDQSTYIRGAKPTDQYKDSNSRVIRTFVKLI